MSFRRFLKENLVCLDGGMGTLLQQRGLAPGEQPERWNLTHPEVITALQRAYFDAGSHVVCSNTFGANVLKFSESELEDIVKAALDNARAAAVTSANTGKKFVALDIGPTGRLLKPLGDLDFEDAVRVFAKTVRLGVRYGADLIVIETMNDCYETKAALLAAKENSDLPVIVTNAYGEDGKLMTGASPEAMVAMLEGMGADAIGANCSLGPAQLRGVAERLLACASVPVVLKPNAGLPTVINGQTVYDIGPAAFADEVLLLVRMGVRAVGGCCGTTPAYIEALSAKLQGQRPQPIPERQSTLISSYTHAVCFGESPILIGERINPTGKKRFKQALVERDMAYILTEGVNQQEKGVQALDVNVGLPGIDEVEMLRDAVCELQSVTDLPLQIDTANVAAMEAALRRYNGKAMINSVSGKQESMEAIFPLVKKYGGVVVALTLDERGIPDTVEGRVEIAVRILETARAYGISKKDIVFDPLAMTISADTQAANVTLGALARIKSELGCHTSLGVSNVSFGLPARDAVNSTFFALALSHGLSAAIMNPYSADMMKVYHAYRALRGVDPNCAAYMEAASGFAVDGAPATQVVESKPVQQIRTELAHAICKGFRERAAELTQAMLQEGTPALEIVNREIIPALNDVGQGFEEKTVYLPSLLMSAEAAKSAFEVIKRSMSAERGQGKGIFVIATVQGDIHDIGKNIVKLLLENYGFDVIDLGKDVAPEAVACAVQAHQAPLVGLSALMTTTVPAMEQTILLLRERAPWCRIVVGGAVLTKEYAERIGADYYAKDAMETVRYAERMIAAL